MYEDKETRRKHDSRWRRMIGLRRDKAELGQVKSMSTFLGKNLGLVPFWIHWDPPKKTVRKEYVSCNFFREVKLGGWGHSGSRPQYKADLTVLTLLFYVACAWDP